MVSIHIPDGYGDGRKDQGAGIAVLIAIGKDAGHGIKINYLLKNKTLPGGQGQNKVL
jgi:hypothetical protein